jgi:ATP diphosphatase
MSAPAELDRLLGIMARLRDPQQGCPWDVQQNFASIAPYTIEEAYEVADAIDRGDLDDLCDELGDLLLQVVFHAQMASEQGAFGFADVARAISDKLQRRHPHVFAQVKVDGAEDVNLNWEAIKRAERAAKGETDGSALAGISRGLPEWQRAVKLQSRAARVGFDWPGPAPVLDKVREELDEVAAEFARGPVQDNQARLEEELGDLRSSAPTWPGTRRWMWVPHCARPTTSSSAASAPWRRTLPRMAGRWTSWTWTRRNSSGNGSSRTKRGSEDTAAVRVDRRGRNRRLLPPMAVAAS